MRDEAGGFGLCGGEREVRDEREMRERFVSLARSANQPEEPGRRVSRGFGGGLF